jgi:hypothetical protein
MQVYPLLSPLLDPDSECEKGPLSRLIDADVVEAPPTGCWRYTQTRLGTGRRKRTLGKGDLPMRTKYLALIFGCLMISACSGDIYSATSTKDGVIILNRLTGTVRQVEGDILVELADGHIRPPPPPIPPHRPSFAAQAIPKQPFLITAISKFRNAMLLKLSIEPDAVLKTPGEWRAWRDQLSAVRSNSSLHLEFQDADGFIVSTHDVALFNLRQSVDSGGEVIGVEDQVDIPMTADEYNQVTQWQVGWSGFLKDFKPAAN